LRLDQAMQRLLPDFSRSRLQSWINQGLVRVDGQAAAAKRKVWGGESVTATIPALPETLAFAPQAIALDILFEDATLLVVDKPAGLVVHPGSGNWEGTLLNALLHHAPQLASIPRAGIVHRLDKDTSGLLVVAKTLAAHSDLVRQLQERSVKRDYLAIVEGCVMDDGTVAVPVGRHPLQRTRMAVTGAGKMAVTHYHVIERLPYHTLVECRLETGRTHQIRVHMQHIGHPLAGDPVYRAKRSAAGTADVAQALKRFGRQALHARSLALLHPASRERVSWTASMPDDMLRLLEALRRRLSIVKGENSGD
jgi:23S rRNA pseudouridine1911/1915/1917 synthase